MRVGIVNDLAVACEALRRVVLRDPSMSVAWTAHDGVAAVECARRDRPDLVLMDLIMPRMDGVEATRLIMRGSPCPILVVTATVTGNAALVYEALGAGALDAVNTPTFGPGAAVAGGEELLERMRRVGRKQKPLAAAPVARIVAQPGPAPLPRIVAIGASTGGPRAVADVLAALPPSLDAAVIVVQHLSAPFMQGFADWLAAETRRGVALARHGHALRAGEVLVAGEERHLVVDGAGRLAYRDDPADHVHRPAVDELFASLAAYPRAGVAALLTGMGRDGAEGLLRLRHAGWHTIAQDERTSVVWGMPGAAHQLGAAVETLAVDRIAPAIAASLRSAPKPGSVP